MDNMKIYDLRTLASVSQDEPAIIDITAGMTAFGSVGAIYAFKNAHPDWRLFMDLKLEDDDIINAKMAFDAGADIVSVSGNVSDETLKNAEIIADANGASIMLDVRHIRNKEEKAEDASIYGIAYIRGSQRDDMTACNYGIRTREWIASQEEAAL